MQSLDYESQENSIVPKLLCKAQFTRFTMILMSLVILQVFAAYKRKRVFSIMGSLGNLIFWKLKKKSCSIHLFYGGFHPCSTNMSYHSLTDPLRDTWGGVKSEGWTDHFNNNKMISMSVVYSLSFSPLRLFFWCPATGFGEKNRVHMCGNAGSLSRSACRLLWNLAFGLETRWTFPFHFAPVASLFIVAGWNNVHT